MKTGKEDSKDYFRTKSGCLAGSRSESVSGEEASGRFGKFLWKLKMRTVPGIRKKHEPGVGKLLLKDERIHGGDHNVVMTVHHEGPVQDVLQRAETLAGHLAPSGISMPA